MSGPEGREKIDGIMEDLRRGVPPSLHGLGVRSVRDYEKREEVDIKSGQISPLALPPSNVIYYVLEGGAWCCIRPSGTEPKLKIYLGVKEETLEAARSRLSQLNGAISTLLEPYR